MRRADRLFELILLLRSRRLSTAEWLAKKLEVSLRTVYRDVADLKLQGLPIEGETGVGYRLRPGFDLAPLMFTPAEAQALYAALNMAMPRLDEGLARAAEHGLRKIMAVLPDASRDAATRLPLYAPRLPESAAARKYLEQLRECSVSKRKVALRYTDLQGTSSERVVRPLACIFWGNVWTLGAYCELRAGFRHFRIDHVTDLRVEPAFFTDEPGKTLDDLWKSIQDRPEASA